MTFVEYWYRLCVKRPALNDSTVKVEFSVDNLRKALEMAYDAGKAAGIAAMEPTKKPSVPDILDLLRGMK